MQTNHGESYTGVILINENTPKDPHRHTNHPPHVLMQQHFQCQQMISCSKQSMLQLQKREIQLLQKLLTESEVDE